MTYRIVVGVSDEDLANSLRARFRELADYAVVATETTSADLAAVVGSDPELDAVLIHDQLGPVSAMETVRDLALRHPHLGIILIVDESSPEVLTQAMESGARGVLGRDAGVEELSSRMAAAADWSRSMRRHLDASVESPLTGQRGTVVAIAGSKGGTGTTTLAVQLAMASVAAENTTCLIDLDLQTGDLPTYLDLTHRRSILDLVDVADDINGTILADTLFVHPAGPHVLLAPAEGERGEDVNARVTRQIIGALRSRYNNVIIDCGSYMTDAGAMAVEIADKVVMTVSPDLPGLRAGKRLAKMWTRLQVRKEEELSVVLVRHSKNNEIQPDAARKIIGLPMLRTTIPAAYRAVEKATNLGDPTGIDDDGFRRTIGQLAMELGVVKVEAKSQESKRRKGDKGAVMIEFAGMVPFLGLMLLLVWQVILVGLTSMYASHAADEGARAAGVIGESKKYCPQPEHPHQICQVWQEVHDRAVARVSKPWNDKGHFEFVMYPKRHYVQVSIDTPAVLPTLHTPFAITTQAKVVDEGGDNGSVLP